MGKPDKLTKEIAVLLVRISKLNAEIELLQRERAELESETSQNAPFPEQAGGA